MANTESLDYVVELTREQVEGKLLVFRKGLAAANLQDPQQSHDYDWTLENVIEPLMRAGHLGDGVKTRFDDRKLRYDRVEVDEENGLVAVSLGVTHYNAYDADRVRGPKLNADMQDYGEQLFGDRYAFFARPLGIAVVPITLEGAVVVGRRTNIEYGDYIAGTGKNAMFVNPEEFNLLEEQKRALTEFGIREDELRGALVVTGIAYHPNTGETDICAIARVNLSDEFFLSGEWLKRIENSEHESPLVVLRGMSPIEAALSGNLSGSEIKHNVLYQTRQPLESIRQEDITPIN